MKAYIVHDSPLGTDYWNEGKYSTATVIKAVVEEKPVEDQPVETEKAKPKKRKKRSE